MPPRCPVLEAREAESKGQRSRKSAERSVQGLRAGNFFTCGFQLMRYLESNQAPKTIPPDVIRTLLLNCLHFLEVVSGNRFHGRVPGGRSIEALVT